MPGGPGIRDDSGIYEGYEVGTQYDSLLSKLVAYGHNRSDAILRMRRALEEYRILGLKTTLPFLDRVLHHPSFEAGDFDTGFVEKVFAQSDRERHRPWDVAVAAAAIRAYRERIQSRGAAATAQAASSGWHRRDWRRPEGHF